MRPGEVICGFGQLADDPGEEVQINLGVALPKEMGQSRETAAGMSQQQGLVVPAWPPVQGG